MNIDLDDQIEGYEEPESGGWGDYPLDELAMRDERRSAVDVLRRIEQGRFILDPDFQRAFVWDTKKQSRLIESVLLRIPLPVFYVAENSSGNLVVVDGLQRLTTLQNFFEGKLKLQLPDRKELDKRRFSQLQPRLQNRIEDCQLHFYIIDSNVPERARLDIFERVNGGEALTRQQMRNAIFNGPATRFLREMAESDIFRIATGRSLNSNKMQDREFVNRFCSFMMFGSDEYRADMDDWLARSLKEMNYSDPSLLDRLGHDFERSLINNYIVYGEHSFRKRRLEQTTRSVINASLFDVMSTGLARYDTEIVRSKEGQLKAMLYELMEDEEFISSITYSPNTPKVVRMRFAIMQRALSRVFGD